MTWHRETVTADDLASLLARIRRAGGTVANSRPGTDGVCVTWTTASNSLPAARSRPSGG